MHRAPAHFASASHAAALQDEAANREGWLLVLHTLLLQHAAGQPIHNKGVEIRGGMLRTAHAALHFVLLAAQSPVGSEGVLLRVELIQCNICTHRCSASPAVPWLDGIPTQTRVAMSTDRPMLTMRRSQARGLVRCKSRLECMLRSVATSIVVKQKDGRGLLSRSAMRSGCIDKTSH